MHGRLARLEQRRQKRRNIEPATIAPGGAPASMPGAGAPSRRRLVEAAPRRLAATLHIDHIETFVPAAGEAVGPPTNPRHVYLEGRRPRRLVATCDIKRMKHLFPWAPRPVPLQIHSMLHVYLRLPRAPPRDTTRDRRIGVIKSL